MWEKPHEPTKQSEAIQKTNETVDVFECNEGWSLMSCRVMKSTTMSAVKCGWQRIEERCLYQEVNLFINSASASTEETWKTSGQLGIRFAIRSATMSAVKVIGGGTEELCSHNEDKVFNAAAPISAVTVNGAG